MFIIEELKKYNNEKLAIFVNMDGVDYPVYNINNNKNLSSIELKKFMEYNIIEMINYYNLYKEDKEYGFKENSKRYLAK